MRNSGECWPVLDTFQGVNYQKVTMETFLTHEQNPCWLVTGTITCEKAGVSFCLLNRSRGTAL